jgi:dihydroorotase
MKLIIRDATVIDSKSPFHNQKVDIQIENGLLSKIDSKIENTGNYNEVQLENLHVSQGWFDSSVSLR